jgi:hypothetical protein
MKEFLIMKKYRINLTVEDYFDYVGTRPFMSVKDRMLFSLPEEFRKGYNIKFKKFHSWHDFYRVHLSLITTEEVIQKVIERYKTTGFICNNITYKEIKKVWLESKVH